MGESIETMRRKRAQAKLDGMCEDCFKQPKFRKPDGSYARCCEVDMRKHTDRQLNYLHRKGKLKKLPIKGGSQVVSAVA